MVPSVPNDYSSPRAPATSLYPQPAAQKPGLGFPLARIGAAFSLACGAVVGLGICRYAGKGQSDLGLLRTLLDLFRPGDVVLGDRLMCAWTEMVMLKMRGVDCVCRFTYLTKGVRRVTEFTGGVVATSNVPLGRDPVAAALASRLAVLEHEPTDDMLVAFMAAEARKGVKDVPPAECLGVLEHVVTVCRGSDYRPDLRYFFKGLEDYRCWKAGDCETDWRILVQSGIRRADAGGLPAAPATRAGRKVVEHAVVRELNTLDLTGPNLEKAWKARTGKAMDSYYRRKRELGLR